ncbi:DUF4142 domain-containing protein [Hymenobacter sp. NBH84]|uniref:DUF4142 domain-containing protein n=1 Tax=Hymenobacter sp. NBH84 TaxID=2596915 RepID=UPI00162AF60C|nr:DUF4142 domain-containing protein [Hymenobacter sp. NBH84]QNE41378.1 DUF4142 domain-containing protein [Hymenobacter sp. NBH84]
MKTSFLTLTYVTALVAMSACSQDNTATTDTAAENVSNTDSGPMTMHVPDTSNTDVTTAAEARTAPPMLNGSTITGKDFVLKADQGGHNEIGLSKLALEKGVTGDVKAFATKMIDDHTKAGNELKVVAQKKNIALPGEMDPYHKSLYDQMSKMSGKQFEQAYVSQMVKDHQQTVDLLNGEIQAGSDPDVKAWAQKTLPVVQQHTTMAQHNEGMNM